MCYESLVFVWLQGERRFAPGQKAGPRGDCRTFTQHCLGKVRGSQQPYFWMCGSSGKSGAGGLGRGIRCRK